MLVLVVMVVMMRAWVPAAPNHAAGDHAAPAIDAHHNPLAVNTPRNNSGAPVHLLDRRSFLGSERTGSRDRSCVRTEGHSRGCSCKNGGEDS
jgi:hypothetical protein